MADLTETVLWRGGPPVGIRVRLIKHDAVDTDDTLTVGELTKLLHAEAFRMDTGASITCTIATNVVTVTQAGMTDIPVLVCCTGT